MLVTAVAGLTLLRRAQSMRSTSYVPFVLALFALLYSYMVGLIQQPVVAATYDLLNWGGPLLFGLHLALEWRQFPRMRGVLVKVSLWGLLVTCTYGLWQFVDPPVWDRVWVVNAEMFSVGVPVPFLIRVFSTMNAPGPFAAFLVFAVLVGLSGPQRWKFLALALGLTVLLLTKTRSAWGAFLIGALLLQLRQPLRALPRQWLALAVVLLLAAPAISHPRVLQAVSGRAASLSRIDNDRSYRERMQITNYVLSRVKRNPAGEGLGQLGGAGKLQVSNGRKVSVTSLDSGLLEVFSVMGWVGGALFTIALFGTLIPIVREGRGRRDQATNGAAAAVVALLTLSFFGNVFSGVAGIMFWSAVGIVTAGRTYALAVEQLRRYSGQPGTPLNPGARPHLPRRMTTLPLPGVAVPAATPPGAVAHPATPLRRIRSNTRRTPLDLRELWRYRDLWLTLALRDVKLRYRQTALGVAWVVLLPLLASGIFTLVFGVVAKMPSDGSPYFLFVFAGYLGWNAFQNTLQRCGISLIGNTALVTKVYFPRIILPAASVLASLLDFAIGVVMLLLVLLVRGELPSPLTLALVPLFMLILQMLALGLGFFSAALSVRFRDVTYVLPFLIQLLLYASPSPMG